MQVVPYALAVSNLKYVMFYTKLDICFCSWYEQMKISVNTNILVLEFYEYIYWKYWYNINRYFDKNINKAKIIQNSWKYLEKTSKNNKISKNAHVKVIL